MEPVLSTLYPLPPVRVMGWLSGNSRQGFQAAGSTLQLGFEAAKYLNRVGDTASVVRYAWLESLKAQQQIVSQLHNFDSIVNARVDDIIASVKSDTPILISSSDREAAEYAANPGGDIEGAQNARSILTDSVGKGLISQIEGEVKSVLADSTTEQKDALLGKVVHQNAVDAPSSAQKAVGAVAQWGIGKIPFLGSVVNFFINNTVSNATIARENTVQQIQQSLGK